MSLDEDKARAFLVAMLRLSRSDHEYFAAITAMEMPAATRDRLGKDGEHLFNAALEAFRAAIGGVA